MLTTVYMKDGVFLPSIIELSEGDSVSFSNEDAVTYELHFRNNSSIPETRVRSKKIATIKFPKHGRYEITEAVDRNMQCVVEVKLQDAENTPKSNVRYFPLSKDQRAVEILPSKPPPLVGSARLPIHKTLPRASLSPWFDGDRPILSKDNKDLDDSDGGDDEEFDNLKSLRRLCKQGSSSALSEHQRQPTTEQSLNVAKKPIVTIFQEETPKKLKFDSVPFEHNNDDMTFNSNGNFPRTSQSSETPIDHGDGELSGSFYTVYIKDFDFNLPGLDVEVGDSIEFKLAASVPLHAEHEIYGSSETKDLCFLSPMLQVDETRSFVFSPLCEGEVVVSCRIYREMQCVIRVHPQGSLTNQLDESRADSIITADAVVGMSYQMIPDGGDLSMNTAHAFDEDSFYDSDDIITEEERESRDNDHKIMYTLKDTKIGQNVADSWETYNEELLDSEVKHSVYIINYYFKPTHLVCKVGEKVRFVLDLSLVDGRTNHIPSGIHVMDDTSTLDYCLECDGLFDIVLSKANPTFIYQFNYPGDFEVKNKVYSFSACMISVSLDSPPPASKKPVTPSLFGSFTKMPNDLPSRPIFNCPANDNAHRFPSLHELKSPSHEASKPSNGAIKQNGDDQLSVAIHASNLKADVMIDASDSDQEVVDNVAHAGAQKKKTKTAKKRQNQRKRARESKQQTGTEVKTLNGEKLSPKEDKELFSLDLSSVVFPDLNKSIGLSTTASPCHSMKVESTVPTSPEKLSFVQALCDDFVEFSDDGALDGAESDAHVDRMQQAKPPTPIFTADGSTQAKENVVLSPKKVFNEMEDASSEDSYDEKDVDSNLLVGLVDSSQQPTDGQPPPVPSSIPNYKTNMLRSFLQIKGESSQISQVPRLGIACNGLKDLDKILVPEVDSDASSDDDESSLEDNCNGAQNFDSDGYVNQEEIFFCSFFEHRLTTLKEAAAKGQQDTLPSGRKVPIVFWKPHSVTPEPNKLINNGSNNQKVQKVLTSNGMKKPYHKKKSTKKE